jgi:DNA-binding NtrC family response regulator
MDTTEKKPPARAARPAAPVGLALVFLGGEIVLPPRRYRPGPEALPVGRDEASGGVVLASDSRVSRRHASVHRGPLGRLRVIDEGSTNGTFVNGARVAEAALAPGDVLTVGDSLLVVSAEPEGPDDGAPSGFVGASAAARRLRAELGRVAPSDATVLLLGETGSGKEVAARALHALSGRKGPFIAINCSAVPESLAESELFGHEKGAFTGAVARPGLFRAAEGGTLFLDEIGEMPPALQPKLLRALQERAVLPVGATAPHPCDVRVVAATNRDLAAAAAARAFRGDLYARLAEFPVHLPPLRERREDVLALFAHALGAGSPRLEAALAERLLLHGWPYNVRELRSIAKRLRILSGEGPYVLAPVEAQLAPSREGTAPPSPPRHDLATAAPLPASAVGPDDGARPEARGAKPDGVKPDDRGAKPGGGRAEPPRDPPPGRAQLEVLLRRHGGVVSEVARAMGRSRKQVYRWLEHHGLDAEAFRRLEFGPRPRRGAGPRAR